MTPEEYIQLAKATDVPNYDKVRERLLSFPPEILHAMLGIASESGEFVDAIKKHILYGKELDLINLCEECGDLFWYIAILCEYTGIGITQIMEQNIAKLRSRFPNRFTEYDALNRDLIKERKILEGK